MPPSRLPGALRRSLGNAAWLLAGGGGAALLALAATALAARTLGGEEFGVLALVHAGTLVIAAVFRFNAGPVLIRYGSSAVARRDGASLVALLLAVGIADLAGALAALAAAAASVALLVPALDWPEPAVALARWYFPTVALLLSATPLALLRLLGCFHLAAWHRLVLPAVRLVGTLVVVAAGGGLAAVAGVWLSSHLLETATAWWWALVALKRADLLAWPRRPWAHGLRPPRGLWRALFALNLSGTLGLLSSRAVVVAVGSLLDPLAAGRLQLAMQVAGGLERLTETFRRALEPELAALHRQSDRRRLSRLVRRASLGLLAATSPLLPLALLAGAPLLEVLAGPEFGEAADVLALLVLRQWLAGAALAAPPLLVLCDRAGTLLWTVALARLVQLALVLPLLPAIGLLAAGIAGLAGGLVETVWLLATLLRLLGRG